MLPFLHLRMFPKKRLDLGGKQIGIISSMVNLYLIEVKCACQFVFAHKVYLVLAFLIPPAAYSQTAVCQTAVCDVYYTKIPVAAATVDALSGGLGVSPR